MRILMIILVSFWAWTASAYAETKPTWALGAGIGLSGPVLVAPPLSLGYFPTWKTPQPEGQWLLTLEAGLPIGRLLSSEVKEAVRDALEDSFGSLQFKQVHFHSYGFKTRYLSPPDRLRWTVAAGLTARQLTVDLEAEASVLDPKTFYELATPTTSTSIERRDTMATLNLGVFAKPQAWPCLLLALDLVALNFPVSWQESIDIEDSTVYKNYTHRQAKKDAKRVGRLIQGFNTSNGYLIVSAFLQF